MASKIGGYGKDGVDVASARSARGTRSDGPERVSDAAPAPKREPAVDSVRITDTAAQLKQLEARLAAQPDVDQARVDKLRQRLESGEYRVNAERVAERLLRLERDLG